MGHKSFAVPHRLHPAQGIAQDQAEASRVVEAKVKGSGTSFYWAMRFQSLEKRRALFAIYAFCRAVDDIADSNKTSNNKMRALKMWRRHIDCLFEGCPRESITRALQPALRDYGLKKQAFVDVIAGMEMDAKRPIVAPLHKTLVLYCSRVASAVGLLCIRVFGVQGGQGKAVAFSLGPALQLTNILRDLREDAAAGRLYLPRELLKKHGIRGRNPIKILENPKIESVCDEVVIWAEKHFAQAEIALANCKKQSIRPATIMKNVYKKNLLRLQSRGFTPAAIARPESAWQKFIRKTEKFCIALKSLS